MDDRARLVARWLVLTKEVLPGMAAGAGWPIRHDHCFMRVFLDGAVGGRWDRAVKPPAIHNMDRDTLARAVAQAEEVVRFPGLLPALNRRSLRWRRDVGA